MFNGHKNESNFVVNSAIDITNKEQTKKKKKIGCDAAQHKINSFPACQEVFCSSCTIATLDIKMLFIYLFFLNQSISLFSVCSLKVGGK